MEDFKAFSVSGLRAFLAGEGISIKTLENFSSNMVSGLAMTLLDEAEIKELVPIIGDRAILRNILMKLKQVYVLIQLHNNDIKHNTGNQIHDKHYVT